MLFKKPADYSLDACRTALAAVDAEITANQQTIADAALAGVMDPQDSRALPHQYHLLPFFQPRPFFRTGFWYI